MLPGQPIGKQFFFFTDLFFVYSADFQIIPSTETSALLHMTNENNVS